MSASCCCSASGCSATLRAQQRQPARRCSGPLGVARLRDRPLQLGRIRPLLHRSGFLTPLDRLSAWSLIVLVFEARAPVDGPGRSPIISRRLPRLLLLRSTTCRRRSIHRGYDFEQIVDHFAFGTEGIYGTPVYVSAAYIFIFVVFAAFLERAGMIALFNDVALGLVGHWRGGPAQVCVLSSALMGTISGSGVANVVAPAASSPSR